MISDRRARRAEIDGLEVREQAVVALDRHHRLARGDLVALAERVHLEVVPARDPRRRPPSRPEHSLRTAIASSIPPSTESRFWKTCISDVRVVVLRLEQLLGVDEVRVGVVPPPDAVDGQAEDRGIEPRLGLRRHAGSL